MAAVAFTMVVVALVTAFPGGRSARRGARALHQLAPILLRTLGIERIVRGAPRSGPALVVGNHVSWLDLLVLAAQTPTRPVVEHEIAQWPFLGWVSRRCGVLFYRRGSWRELPRMVDEIAAALRSGDRVQVFPEGTTSCGGALGAFHRAAFQAAIDAAVVIIPVTLSYRTATGERAACCTFIGDDTLARSLRRVIALQSITVTVHWLAPIPAIIGTGIPAVDRAVAARAAQQVVAADLRVDVVERRRTQAPDRPPALLASTR